MAAANNIWTGLVIPFLAGGLVVGGLAVINLGAIAGYENVTLFTLMLPTIFGGLAGAAIAWVLQKDKLQSTRQLAAEQELAKTEARYREIIESTTDLITIVDGDGRLTFVNHMSQQIFGLSPEDCIGRSAFDFIHPEDMEATTAAFQHWLESDQPSISFENRQVHQDGSSRHMLWNIQHHRADNGDAPGFMSTARDISEQKNLEAQLRQSQKLEVVGQLTGGVAHDFNNLLAVMMGNAEMLEDAVSGDKDAERELQAIAKAIDRAAALTGQLLAFSRQQTLTPASVNVSDLIVGLEEMLRRSLGELVNLSVQHTDDLWPAQIDRHQFENALINLAVNARDAMPQGGELVFETSNVTLDEDDTKAHDDVTPGDYVRIEVRDTGCGMAEDVTVRVFEPFFTTKEVGEGSGLGLSMVFGFVKQSSGHITMSSEVGIGTKITLFLPRSQTKSQTTSLIEPAQN
jgi:PAS domain S-box-containing protein